MAKPKESEVTRLSERVALLMTPAERERLRAIEKREDRGPTYLIRLAVKAMYTEIFKD